MFNFFLVEMDSIPSTTLGVFNIWEFDNCNSGFQKKNFHFVIIGPKFPLFPIKLVFNPQEIKINKYD